MGKTQSKEEIIIAQAGNSGGATNEATQGTGWSTKDIMSVIVLVLASVVIGWYIVNRCRTYMMRKMRAEIARSREQV